MSPSEFLTFIVKNSELPKFIILPIVSLPTAIPPSAAPPINIPLSIISCKFSEPVLVPFKGL